MSLTGIKKIYTNAQVSPWLLGATCLPVVGSIISVVERCRRESVRISSPGIETDRVRVLSRAVLFGFADIIREFVVLVVVVSLVAMGIFTGLKPILLLGALVLLIVLVIDDTTDSSRRLGAQSAQKPNADSPVNRPPKSSPGYVLGAEKVPKSNQELRKFKVDRETRELSRALEAVQKDGLALRTIGGRFRNNREVGLAAMKQNGLAFIYAGPELQKDQEIIAAALAQNSTALKQDDYFRVLSALRTNGLALQFVSERLKNRDDVVMTALKQNGLALQHAGNWAKYRNQVLAAVEQNGLALQFASEFLKDDEAIVLAAVQKDGLSLAFASFRLRGNFKIVLAAITQNSRAYIWANLKLFREPIIQEAAESQ